MDLIDLVKAGNFISLEDKLKKFIDPNYSEDGVTLLHYAVAYEQHAVADLLVRYGADINMKDIILNQSPLQLANEEQNNEMTKILKPIIYH